MSLDPVSVSVLGSLTVNGIIEAIKLAAQAYSAHADSEIREEQAVGFALRLWGSVHHESRRNIERIRHIVEQNPKGTIKSFTAAPFDFSVSNAVLPDLCRFAPNPKLLDEITGVISAIRRVSYYHERTAALYNGTIDHVVMLPFLNGFAHDAIEKGIVQRFNRMNALGRDTGNVKFADRWTPDACFPPDIDPSARIDHSLI